MRSVHMCLAVLSCLLLSPRPARADAPQVGYDKGFFLRSEDGRTRLDIDVTAHLRLDLAQPGPDQPAVQPALRRGRFILGGHVWGDRFRWKLQLAFDRGAFSLKDLYLDYAIVPGWLQVRVGQWKRATSRQWLTSAFRLELIDRAITHSASSASRDIGIALHNGLGDGFTWSAALLSGGSEERPHPHPVVVLRTGWGSEGLKGYAEGDHQGGAPRIGVGGSLLVDFDLDGDGVSQIEGTVDMIFKAHGFAATAAFFAGSGQHGTFTERQTDLLGGHVQLSQMILGRVQPAVRYAVLGPFGRETSQQLSAGVNGYILGQQLKLMGGVDVQWTGATPPEVSGQLQLQGML